MIITPSLLTDQQVACLSAASVWLAWFYHGRVVLLDYGACVKFCEAGAKANAFTKTGQGGR
jgi:hypothetical protein